MRSRFVTLKGNAILHNNRKEIMTSLTELTTHAIKSAQDGRWEDAKAYNAQILEQEPTNTAATNRMAFCEMQLGNGEAARQLYEQVLTFERHNPIANKYLSLLKQKVKFTPPALHKQEDFIEEPGKSKSLALVRLADPDVLQTTAISTPCELVVKNHRVNVQTKDGKIYLGALPDDIAFRLQKLIRAGNTYNVFVQSTSKKNCTVFIKETYRSPDAMFSASFPSASVHGTPALQEDVLLDEAPLDTRETGSNAEEAEIDPDEREDITE
jgi:hypothetical protein